MITPDSEQREGQETGAASAQTAGSEKKHDSENITDCQNESQPVHSSFYGFEHADVKARTKDYPGIETPRDLYYALCSVWSRETCTPRMRKDWSEKNRTLGQCSITAFLAQDIFGGRVFGVPLGDGNYHCFNTVGDCIFDLTSEQFGERSLSYTLEYEQFRRDHLQRDEKRHRYEVLKEGLKREALSSSGSGLQDRQRSRHGKGVSAE